MKKGVMIIFVLVLFSFAVFGAVEIPKVGDDSSLKELDESVVRGDRELSGGTTIYYYAGSRLLATDNDIDGRKYYHQDRLRSNRVITDSSGSKIGEYKSLPYGQKIVDTTGGRFTFTGQELDESGLHDFKARQYDSDSGRFLSTDPIMDDHAYAYVSNNPMNLIDPSGLAGERGEGESPPDFADAHVNTFTLNVNYGAASNDYTSPVGNSFPGDTTFTASTNFERQLAEWIMGNIRTEVTVGAGASGYRKTSSFYDPSGDVNVYGTEFSGGLSVTVLQRFGGTIDTSNGEYISVSISGLEGTRGDEYFEYTDGTPSNGNPVTSFQGLSGISLSGTLGIGKGVFANVEAYRRWTDNGRTDTYSVEFSRALVGGVSGNIGFDSSSTTPLQGNSGSANRFSAGLRKGPVSVNGFYQRSYDHNGNLQNGGGSWGLGSSIRF